MHVLREIQPRVFQLTGGLFANWMPPDQVDVGDYGIIARDRFVRDGSLRDWGIEFDDQPTKKSKGKLEYSDRVKLTLSGMAKAHAGLQLAAQAAPPSASAGLRFEGRGSFLYHLSGITTRRFKNSKQFFEDLTRALIAGERSWDKKSVIVTETRVAEKGTIVVSDSRDASLDLHGDFPLTGDGVLAGVRGGLAIARSSGSIFKWLAADNTIPIIGLVRPVFGDPSGGDVTPAPPDGPGLLERLRNLFRERYWDIRTIVLKQYVETEIGPKIIGSLMEEENFQVQFNRLSLENFLSLSDQATDESTFIEENVETQSFARGAEA